jgi:hypothetical protein
MYVHHMNRDEDVGEDDSSQVEEKLPPSDQPAIVLHNPYLDVSPHSLCVSYMALKASV